MIRKHEFLISKAKAASRCPIPFFFIKWRVSHYLLIYSYSCFSFFTDIFASCVSFQISWLLLKLIFINNSCHKYSFIVNWRSFKLILLVYQRMVQTVRVSQMHPRNLIKTCDGAIKHAFLFFSFLALTSAIHQPQYIARKRLSSCMLLSHDDTVTIEKPNFATYFKK